MSSHYFLYYILTKFLIYILKYCFVLNVLLAIKDLIHLLT